MPGDWVYNPDTGYYQLMEYPYDPFEEDTFTSYEN